MGLTCSWFRMLYKNRFQIDRSNCSLIQSAYNQVPDNAKATLVLRCIGLTFRESRSLLPSEQTERIDFS